MSTNVAKPARVTILGASGTYGKGIPGRAEEVGVEAVVVTRSPHKFKDVKATTTVAEAQLDDEEKLKKAFAGCDGVISALGDDRKERPKTHYLPHLWRAMKAAERVGARQSAHGTNDAEGITWVLTDRSARPRHPLLEPMYTRISAAP
jgi:uncharacterized protein YbjT (DUF2867 family)